MNRNGGIRLKLKGNGPREKLSQHGVDYLSNTELLAVVLNVGTRKANILEISQAVIKDYGISSLSTLKDYRRLQKIADLTAQKAMQVIALLELGRRIFGNTNQQSMVFNTPEKVYARFVEMSYKLREELRVLYLNARQRLIGEELLALGNLTGVSLSAREVIAPALEISAAGLIILHNHPSHDPSPSKADINFTQQLLAACKLFNIQVYDHIILAGPNYYSFLEAGIL